MDASEDIVFGADILLSAATAVAQDLQLFEGPQREFAGEGGGRNTTQDAHDASAGPARDVRRSDGEAPKARSSGADTQQGAT